MALRRRILVGEPASEQVLASYDPPPPHITRPLMEAFIRQRLIRITYEDQHGAFTERDVEAQYLYYNVPVWYALTWDHLRDDVRFFRIDRIRNLRSLSTEFRLRRAEAFLSAGEDDARTV